MKKIKIYIAGKISPNSVFGKSDWRDGFCLELKKLSGFDIINLDPTKSNNDFDLDNNNPSLIFGRNCFMIKSADLVVVNLTDDISVGGSQEMLIAKYYHKPLVGIAPKGGKFSKTEKEIFGRTYKEWTEPFVLVPCDKVVESIEGVAELIKNNFSNIKSKNINVIDESVKYYKNNFFKDDKYLDDLLR